MHGKPIALIQCAAFTLYNKSREEEVWNCWTSLGDVLQTENENDTTKWQKTNTPFWVKSWKQQHGTVSICLACICIISSMNSFWQASYISLSSCVILYLKKSIFIWLIGHKFIVNTICCNMISFCVCNFPSLLHFRGGVLLPSVFVMWRSLSCLFHLVFL